MPRPTGARYDPPGQPSHNSALARSAVLDGRGPDSPWQADAGNSYSSLAQNDPVLSRASDLDLALALIARVRAAEQGKGGERSYLEFGSTTSRPAHEYLAQLFGGRSNAPAWPDRASLPKSACQVCEVKRALAKVYRSLSICGHAGQDTARPTGAPDIEAHNHNADNESFLVFPLSHAPRPLRNFDQSTSCVQCWSAPRMSERNDFCSARCANIAAQRGPVLLEIPKGHASFQGVEQHCIDNWKTRASSYPEIKRLYMVQPHMQFDAVHKEYQVNVSSPVGSASEKAGNQVQHWISPSRQCALGDAGYTKPCDSTKCMLCSLVRTAPQIGRYARGVATYSDLEHAVDRATKRSKSHGNILLLSQVILGKSCKKTKDDTSPMPNGCHSVRVIEHTMYGFGSAQWTGETFVFDGRAIKPLYLIVLE